MLATCTGLGLLAIVVAGEARADPNPTEFATVARSAADRDTAAVGERPGFDFSATAELDLMRLFNADYQEGQPLPDDIQELDGSEYEIQGYLDNNTMEGSEVFLMVNDACGCDGMTQVNHYLQVTLDGDVTGYRPERVKVTGTLEVGEELDSDGFVTSVYRLKSARIEELD